MSDLAPRDSMLKEEASTRLEAQETGSRQRLKTEAQERGSRERLKREAQETGSRDRLKREEASYGARLWGGRHGAS